MHTKLFTVTCLTLGIAATIGQAQNLSLRVVESDYGPVPDRHPVIEVRLTDAIGGRSAQLHMWDPSSPTCDVVATTVTSHDASGSTVRLAACDYNRWYWIEASVGDPPSETAGPVIAQTLGTPPDQSQRGASGVRMENTLALVTWEVGDGEVGFTLRHGTPNLLSAAAGAGRLELKYRSVELTRGGTEVPGSRRPDGDRWDDQSEWTPLRWRGRTAVESVSVGSGDLLLVEVVELSGGQVVDGLAFEIPLSGE